MIRKAKAVWRGTGRAADGKAGANRNDLRSQPRWHKPLAQGIYLLTRRKQRCGSSLPDGVIGGWSIGPQVSGHDLKGIVLWQGTGQKENVPRSV